MTLMMWQFKLIVCLIGLFDLSNAQLVDSGQCDPNIQLAQNFNLEKFAGKWYGIGRTDSAVQTADCSTVEWTVTNKSITFFNEAVNNNFREEINGTATLEEGTAKFTLNVTVSEKPLDFWILDTDYNNYALGYACYNRGNFQKNVYVWQLGRTVEYQSELIPALINQTLSTRLMMTLRDLRPIKHSEKACYELRNISPEQPIVLPGQCDQNITVLQNFNPAKFSGVWHNIASYYTVNQKGACQRAQYTLTGNVLNILNTEVINQTVRTINGYAIVSRNDSTAKLWVNMEVVPGTFAQTELFLLGSDYENYAVSYTCEDLPYNRKRVNSWILSRSRTLTPISQVAVNAILDSQLDLNERFFTQISQSNDSCSYLSDSISDNPVVLDGQCDLNITTMPNFNVTKYMGTWYSIESYPSIWESGTCGNAVFSLDGGVVDIVNSQVINQTLHVIHGSANVSWNNGTAKLDVTFPVAGTNQTVTFSYWVLDSDYWSYSLVYSCQNLNSDKMQVWSAKHSRTRNLTGADQDAMDLVIRDNKVLRPDLFIRVNQSEEACFHYPVQTGRQIILPGQCDVNIPVVQSFNVSQYSGTWYQIEHYPQNHQNGTCTGARYTPDQNTSAVNVLNWEVVDGILYTVKGTANVTSTDGSGRLRVRLPVRGTNDTNPPMVESDIWILSTDYIRYSLVYSCVNINKYERAVGAWKLSRTRTMSAAGATAINNYMATRQELHQPFFLNVDQNNQCPEPNSAMF